LPDNGDVIGHNVAENSDETGALRHKGSQ
jgi:hypothetical protein